MASAAPVASPEVVPTPAPNTFAQLLVHRAATMGDRVAYRMFDARGEERGQRSYGALYGDALALATQLRTFTSPGDRVALLLPPGLAYVTALFACLLAQVVAVPAPPLRGRRDSTRVPRLLADAAATAALVAVGERARLAALPWWSPAVALLEVDEDGVPAATADRSVAHEWPEPEPDDLAILQYTSGSTRAPRGVMLTHRQLLANARAIDQANGLREGEVVVFWLPPYHDMGLIGGILQPLYIGATTVLMTPAAFLQRPLTWLELLHRYRAVSTAAPDFAWKLCVERTTAAERAALDLSAMRVAFNGAEPIHYATQQRFVEAFACAGLDPRVFVPCYGLAEATLLVTSAAKGTATRTARVDAVALREGRLVITAPRSTEPTVTLVSCGAPPDGGEVIIVQPDSATRCPDGMEGEIWVRGDMVARGYWGHPTETAAVFGARCVGDSVRSAPWLRTGDLGVWHEGQLFVTGRRSDVIILQGRNIHPQDVEWVAAEAHPALTLGGCVAFGMADGAHPADPGEAGIMVLVEVARSSHASNGEIMSAVRTAVAEVVGLEVQVTCVREHSLPRTTSGKRQRRAARGAWCDGTLTAREEPRGASREERARGVSPMETLSVEPAGGGDRSLQDWALRWIATDTGQRVPLDATRPLADLGLDSMAILRFHLALEGRLQRRLPERLCVEAPSVAALCAGLAWPLVPALSETVMSDPAAPAAVATAAEVASWADVAAWPEVRATLERVEQLQGAFFPLIEGQDGMVVQHDGQRLLHFAGYDYLGFAGDPRVRAAAAAAATTWGTSASASRLVSGERPVHGTLEAALASLLGTADALTFVSGHATAVSVIAHLCGPGDLVCCDERLHNSGWLGARSSGARVLVFPHNDAAALDSLLGAERRHARRVVVAMESLYSTDGDVPDLAAFVAVKRRHGALLFVDEAHGTGVLGATGRGIAEASGVDPLAVDIWMGTLSKALASCGGFIAGSAALVQYLRATCPAFVFSVGMPPATAAAALEAVRLLRAEPERVRRLWARAASFRTAAAAAGLPVRTDAAARHIPIVPLVTGSSSRALALAAALERDGVLAAPMIPPSVPERGALVRFFLSAAHTEEQIATAVAVLARAWHTTTGEPL